MNFTVSSSQINFPGLCLTACQDILGHVDAQQSFHIFGPSVPQDKTRDARRTHRITEAILAQVAGSALHRAAVAGSPWKLPICEFLWSHSSSNAFGCSCLEVGSSRVCINYCTTSDTSDAVPSRIIPTSMDSKLCPLWLSICKHYRLFLLSLLATGHKSTLGCSTFHCSRQETKGAVPSRII